MPRVYADFNGLIEPDLVPLERLGTPRDLWGGGSRVKRGMHLTLYSDSDLSEDMEVDAVAQWIPDARKSANGCWAGEFDSTQFRYVATQEMESVRTFFPCCNCGHNLAEHIRTTGLSAQTQCS